MTDRLGNYYTGRYKIYGPEVGHIVCITDDPDVAEKFRKDPTYTVYNEMRF